MGISTNGPPFTDGLTGFGSVVLRVVEEFLRSRGGGGDVRILVVPHRRDRRVLSTVRAPRLSQGRGDPDIFVKNHIPPNRAILGERTTVHIKPGSTFQVIRSRRTQLTPATLRRI